MSNIAATVEGQQKLQAYCESVYKKVEQGGTLASPNQTEIVIFGPASEELPGGYALPKAHRAFE